MSFLIGRLDVDVDRRPFYRASPRLCSCRRGTAVGFVFLLCMLFAREGALEKGTLFNAHVLSLRLHMSWEEACFQRFPGEMFVDGSNT